jgi:AraC family transcriptional regulator of adaptative response/methylated-DNA-[protein]-cysteine methyltransferase
MEPNDYRRIAEAIRYLKLHAKGRPSLAATARHVGLSPFHFQRLFRNWVGVSPRQFLQALSLTAAKARLQASASILDAAFAAGLSGPGRLHDLFVTLEPATPGQYKCRGQGLTIWYGFHESPFGEVLLAMTERGICHLGFVVSGDRAAALAALTAAWPGAGRVAAAQVTEPVARRAFARPSGAGAQPIKIFVGGTNFQLQVWRALLRVPEGALLSYGALAARLGRPTAHRAVATAVGRNPVAYLIPCHRILRSSGALGGYRWGLPRKRAILARELAAVP